MKPEKPSELFAINGLKGLRPGEHTFFVNEIINFWYLLRSDDKL